MTTNTSTVLVVYLIYIYIYVLINSFNTFNGIDTSMQELWMPPVMSEEAAFQNLEFLQLFCSKQKTLRADILSEPQS